MSQDIKVVKVSRGTNMVTLLGMGLAAYCSWTLNNSVGWAVIHAMFNWLYILYLCAGCGGGLPPEIF